MVTKVERINQIMQGQTLNITKKMGNQQRNLEQRNVQRLFPLREVGGKFHQNGQTVTGSADGYDIVCAIGKPVEVHERTAQINDLCERYFQITADSTDAVDGTGAVIKTFYRGKTGTLTATNSTLSLPILGAMSGSDPAYASETNILKDIPKIIETANVKDVKLPGIIDDGTTEKLLVYSISNNGTLGEKYTVATAGEGDPTKGTYSVTTGTAASGEEKEKPSTLTITPKDGDEKFVIEYKRNVSENAIKITNRSDAFPKSVRLTLKVLIVDPCETDVIRAAYVVIPNFQPSAEVSFGMTTDATLDFTGNLQTSYCAKEKVLYEVIAVQDDIEDDE